MIQIIGLRDSETHKRKRQVLFYQRDFMSDIKIESLEQLFKNHAPINELLGDENYNVYFTVADCHQGTKPRILKEQWHIPFDIDGVAFEGDDDIIFERACAIHKVACEALGVPHDKTLGLFSGNGVQLFPKLVVPITYEDYFDEHREGYAVLRAKIDKALLDAGLTGKCDPNVFSTGRLMRLPNSWNKKPDKPTRLSRVICAESESTDLVVEAKGYVKGNDGETLAKYPEPDTKGVLAGCEFMKYCAENPNDISEPQWYADISIRARLDAGRELVHKASSGYSGYSYDETEAKIDQALKASGPRTCANINLLWDGCSRCKYNGQVQSPITIRGEDYIATKNTGYRTIKMDKDGNLVAGAPNYDDLVKAFTLEYLYRVNEVTLDVWIWDGKVWKVMSEGRIFEWAGTKVREPSISVKEMNEFIGRLRAKNQVSIDFFKSNRQMVNFLNGVYNIDTGELVAHNPDYGLTILIERNYDPNALCPQWDAFMRNIFDSDDIVRLVEEYLGYAISGSTCWLQKALFLLGTGSNGKSTLIDTVKGVIGEKNCASIPLSEMNKDTYRMRMVTSLFNFSEETDPYSLVKSYDFKNIVAGGQIVVKELYKQPQEVVNKCKLIVACNEDMKIYDQSHGMARRLLLVRMAKRFDVAKNTAIPEYHKVLMTEAAGIFNKLIKRYQDLRERKYLLETTEMQKEVFKALHDWDSSYQFYEENMELGVGPELSKLEVYQEYRLFCESHGSKPRDIGSFFTTLYATLKARYNVDVIKNTTPSNLHAHQYEKLGTEVVVEYRKNTNEGKKVGVIIGLKMLSKGGSSEF